MTTIMTTVTTHSVDSASLCSLQSHFADETFLFIFFCRVGVRQRREASGGGGGEFSPLQSGEDKGASRGRWVTKEEKKKIILTPDNMEPCVKSTPLKSRLPQIKDVKTSAVTMSVSDKNLCCCWW